MSRALRLTGEILLPDNMDADALLDEFIQFLSARHCTFGGSVEDTAPVSCPGGDHEHFHCQLCGSRHDTPAQANACFDGHSKEEHLEWVARETGYLQDCAQALFEKIGALNARYGLT